LFFYKDLFKGDVANDLVVVKDDKVYVALGKLPGVDVAKWFKKGKKIRIRMSVTRAFADRSTDVKFDQAKQTVGSSNLRTGD
jgi:hypothetical protein